VIDFWGFVVVILFVISKWLRHVILAKDTENSYRVLVDKSNRGHFLEQAVVQRIISNVS
jgi:hypothetical protein